MAMTAAERGTRYRKRHPDRVRSNQLTRKYGISLMEYEEMYEEQDGKCFICHQPETLIRRGKISPLCVDHKHSNGSVRKLLCHRCNMVLGYLEFADIERLFDYLKR